MSAEHVGVTRYARNMSVTHTHPRALVCHMLAVLVSSGAAACGGEDPCDDVPDDPCAAEPEIRAELQSGVAFWTPDHEDALAARLIPGGFGGVYLEDADTLAIVLVAPSAADCAERHFRAALACGAIYKDSILVTNPPRAIVVSDGEFDAIELLEWRMLATVAFGDPEVRGLGIDRMRNRIVIDVATTDAVQRVEELVVNAGVPRGAFVVEV
jgi:hypothetical protein